MAMDRITGEVCLSPAALASSTTSFLLLQPVVLVLSSYSRASCRRLLTPSVAQACSPHPSFCVVSDSQSQVHAPPSRPLLSS
ncbi:hypothetical protein EJ04DRAFT_512454 [Polyplosphaeria fusca]|uniref:Uncharacterized protein n=1 Tax=Polyplosphaeria fusca TaxID=682080 RepID=A0A9P4V2S1_9PLEO|nr:hypothetical protein EJ04DRAFT_512454 [Polyplosphaeria fusca]